MHRNMEAPGFQMQRIHLEAWRFGMPSHNAGTLFGIGVRLKGTLRTGADRNKGRTVNVAHGVSGSSFLVKRKRMRTIGIDPGTAIMGWGIVDENNGTLNLVDFGTFTTPAGHPQAERLVMLYTQLQALLRIHQPTAAAVEELFFGKNVNTAIHVGQARGVALLALAQAHIEIHEYKPLVVKQAVAGYGGADKKQMQEMVRVTLRLERIPRPDDAADALAIAICHAYNAPMLRRISEQ